MTDTLLDNGTLLIVGSSPERWDDVEKFWEFDAPHDVCCINEAGVYYPCSFKHWFSYHSALLVEHFSPKNPGAMLHTSGTPMSGIKRWRLDSSKGSSSLMATKCALRCWGYKRVVLAGVALSGEYANYYLRHWQEVASELVGLVKSMSGHTKDLLGEPTTEWLSGKGDENDG